MAVVLNRQQTYSPGREGLSRDVRLQFRVADLAARPSSPRPCPCPLPIASAALITRFMITCCNWAGIGFDGGRLLASDSRSSTVLGIDA